MIGDAPFSGLPEVVPKVPPISNLDRLRRPSCGTFCEERSSIPAHDLDSGALRQPLGQGRRLPIGQQINRPSGLDIDQNSPVDAAFAHGVLINADHPWGRRLRVRQRVEQPQHRAAADGHPEDPCHPGTGPASEGEPDRNKRRTQPLRPPAVPPGQP
ncbi:hypothetical protein GCM10010279_64730 [Streptomyces mutabilis]|nr:hypothetical protein GCM10010279_64730 [Streptomyces mutabilis]